MKSGPLSPDEEARLKALWARPGLSVGQIARLLGRREGTVRSWGLRNCGPRPDTRPRRWTPEEDDRLREMLSRGVGCPEAARLLGRPVSGVQTRSQRLTGWTRRGPAGGAKGRALALLRARTPARVVARTVRVSAETVRQWRVEAGIPVFSYAERNRRGAATNRRRGTLWYGQVRWKKDRDRNLAAGWPWATTLQVAILQWLMEAGRPATGDEVRRGLGIAPTSRVSRMLSEMARRGWVWRRKGETDGRFTYYQIAEAVADRRRAAEGVAHAPQN